MAKIAMNTAYNRQTDQKVPAQLKSWKVCGNRMQLTFDSVGSGLFVDGKQPVGLYVSGDDRVYLPAQCEASGDTLEVWCDAIDQPVHAAYSIQSLETCCNLWAGEFPVQPFFTDQEGELIYIEARPWYDTFRSSVWGSDNLGAEHPALFYYPIWNPEAGSMVCPDNAFTLEGQSIRVCSDAPEFGCYVKSWPYNRLDLANFGKLTLQLYNQVGLTAKLILEWDDGMMELPLEKEEELFGCWGSYAAKLENIPKDKEIARMHLRFVQTGNACHFVNFEKMRLWKK